ncbi:MAG: hypothetical protein WBA77_00090 [Microcoleaceae cyanobacterium]
MGTSRLDSTIDFSQTLEHPEAMTGIEMQYPRLKCQISLYSDAIILSQREYHYRLPCQPQSISRLQQLLSNINGTHHLQELQQQFAPENPEYINQFIQQLASLGLIEEGKSHIPDIRQYSILKWEELFAERLSKKLQQQPLHHSAATPPTHFYYGFALEYYHLLSRSNCFYTPLLHFQNSHKIRDYFNHFYSQTNRHSELLLQGFLNLGNTPENIENLMPLPETMALCNALIYWGYSEPLFCMSLLAIWEVQLIKTWEIYLNQYNRDSVNYSFLTAIEQFVQLRQQAKPEQLRHLIISELSHVDHSILEQFQRQIHLFIELTQNFHTAIENYYSQNPYSKRQLSAI